MSASNVNNTQTVKQVVGRLQMDVVARINELAKKSRLKGLTPEEKREQDHLRAQYLHEFRQQFELLIQKTRFGSQEMPLNWSGTKH